MFSQFTNDAESMEPELLLAIVKVVDKTKKKNSNIWNVRKPSRGPKN